MTEFKLSSLLNFKEKKKYTRLISDIDNILKVLELTQASLIFFKHYKPVLELISVIETNKTILQAWKKKYESKLQEIKK